MDIRPEINVHNWQDNQYRKEEQVCFISVGAEPQDSGELQYRYYGVIADLNYKELSQRDFNQLSKAIEWINVGFGHWSLERRGSQKSTGGCHCQTALN